MKIAEASDFGTGSPGGSTRRPECWRRWAPPAVAASLVVYLAFLLGMTHLAQGRLRDSIMAREALELKMRAAALGYFYAERRLDLSNLARSQPVAAFFANRDLGMSMEYGLRASLAAVRAVALRLTAETRVGTAPVYRRIVLFDADGAPLVDTAADPPTAVRWRGEDPGAAVAGLGGTDAQSADPGAIALDAPVRHRGVVRGTLVSWIDQGAALAVLGGAREGVRLGWPYRILSVDEPPPEGTRPQDLAPIDGTGLQLLAGRRKESGPLALTSSWFLAALVVLAAGLILSSALLLVAQRRNLVLQVRMDAASQQRRELADRNERLLQEIAKREELARRLAYQVNYDSLTRLPNRSLALDRLEQHLAVAAREGLSILLLYVDIDQFARVNDSLGHAAGDELLVQAAARLADLIGPGDTLARIAADELLMLYPDRPLGADVAAQAERALGCFSAPFSVAGQELCLGASIGIACSPADGTDGEQLVKHASLAMKLAKEQGRGRYCAFEPRLNRQASEDLAIASRLRGAIGRNELSLAYQPQIDIASGRTVGAEALLRWRSDELGSVSPTRFIPIAEDVGLIPELGAWVLERACRDAAGWQLGGPCRVAVNVSALQLSRPEDFRRSVDAALERSGLSPRLLDLEITERVLLSDRPAIASLLADLDRQGVRLSIDDFGTGYSALSYLRRFPFHVLKIDRAFVHGIPQIAEDAELTRAMVAMAQALGLSVLAEGVERDEQLQFLERLGCDLAQGFLFGECLSAEAIAGQLNGERRSAPVLAVATWPRIGGAGKRNPEVPGGWASG